MASQTAALSINLQARQPKTLPCFSLENKVCLVTGAARGLGLEFCRAFVESGCTSLVILDLKDSEAKDAAEELKKSYESESEPALNVLGLACDVSSEASVEAAFKDVIEKFGQVDVVVACAGIVENYPALDYPADRMKRLFDINVHGAFYTAREAAKYMIDRSSGSIILISSMSASVVNIPQTQAPYNASKAAVRHLATSLAVEWAQKGVRVNSLSPGYMLTKLTKTILANDKEANAKEQGTSSHSESPLQKRWEELTPMGKMGDPEDLKGAIVYLASDASKFMTGAELRVDGGYCAI